MVLHFAMATEAGVTLTRGSDFDIDRIYRTLLMWESELDIDCVFVVLVVSPRNRKHGSLTIEAEGPLRTVIQDLDWSLRQNGLTRKVRA